MLAVEYRNPPDTQARPYFVTTGISVTAGGEVAGSTRRWQPEGAMEEMIAYLTATRGYSFLQASVIASVAADLRIAAIVDAPSLLVALALPLDIFSD